MFEWPLTGPLRALAACIYHTYHHTLFTLSPDLRYRVGCSYAVLASVSVLPWTKSIPLAMAVRRARLHQCSRNTIVSIAIRYQN